MRAASSLFLVCLVGPAFNFEAEQFGIDDSQLLSEARILFPPPDHVFAQNQNLVLSLAVPKRARRLHPQADSVIIRLNHRDVHTWRLSAEPQLERLSLGLPDLSVGEYEASLILASSSDASVSEPQDTVMFFVTAGEREAEPESEEQYFCEAPRVPTCSADLDCGENGGCVRGSCVCAADYVGERCEHSLLEHPTYMPRVHPVLSPSRCEQSLRFSELATSLFEDLSRLQRQCRHGIKSTLVFEPLEYGFAAQVHYLTRYLTFAYMRDKAMLVARWPPPTTQGLVLHEVSADPSPLFLSLYPCSLDSHALAEMQPGYPEDDPTARPERFATQGTFWWRAHLANYILQPTERLRNLVRREKNRMGWAGGVIGLHVRHGDACAHAAVDPSFRPTCKPAADYWPVVREMAQRYGAQSVFVATDDDQVVTEIRQLAASQGIVVMSPNHKRTELFQSEVLIEHRLASGAVNSSVVAETTWLDTFLLADADILVGAFSSQLFRLALELSAVHKGYVPPYSSLDYPWCSAPCTFATRRSQHVLAQT